jgi:hypothetical protein
MAHGSVTEYIVPDILRQHSGLTVKGQVLKMRLLLCLEILGTEHSSLPYQEELIPHPQCCKNLKIKTDSF